MIVVMIMLPMIISDYKKLYRKNVIEKNVDIIN
jgi:hypothetical protein